MNKYIEVVHINSNHVVKRINISGMSDESLGMEILGIIKQVNQDECRVAIVESEEKRELI